MNFVQIEPGNAVPVRPVEEFHQTVCGKPQIVQRGIESLVDVLIVLQDMLKEHGGLSNAPGALDADDTRFPIDLAV